MPDYIVTFDTYSTQLEEIILYSTPINNFDEEEEEEEEEKLIRTRTNRRKSSSTCSGVCEGSHSCPSDCGLRIPFRLISTHHHAHFAYDKDDPRPKKQVLIYSKSTLAF